MRGRSRWAAVVRGSGLVLAVAVGLAGCSGGGASKKSSTSSASSSGAVGSAGTAEGGGTAAGGPGSQSPAALASGVPLAAPAPATAGNAALAGAVPPSGPRIVRTGTVAVRVPRHGLSKAFDDVAAIATANGGFVSDSNTSTADRAATATLVLRVPTANFDAATTAIGRLGSIDQKEIKGQDVTGQLVDLNARIQSLQAEENALRTLVGQAKAVGEVLQVQDQLFQVRQQIEQLSAQQASLDDQATFASIEAHLTEAPVGAPKSTKPSLAVRAVRLARDNSIAVARAVLLTLGWAFPLLVLLLAARLAWPFLRRIRAAD